VSFDHNSPKLVINRLYILLKKILIFALLNLVILAPLLYLLSSKDYNSDQFYYFILSNIFIILAIDFYSKKFLKPEVITDHSFLEKTILYFFYYDIRFSIILSKISNFFKSVPKKKIRKSIFLISVARSATTVVATSLMRNGNYGGLKFSDLPFSLAPEIANKFKKKNVSSVRMHSDKDYQDLYTSDALDEPMMYYLDLFFDDKIYLRELKKWHERISDAQKKETLIFKNNNNYKRLSRLVNFKKAVFLVLFRDPLRTAFSLYRNHIKFIDIAKKDQFFFDYLKMLRHIEFGPHHNIKSYGTSSRLSPNTQDYWLEIWIDFSNNVLRQYKKRKNNFLFFSTDQNVSSKSVKNLIKIIENKKYYIRKKKSKSFKLSYSFNYRFSKNKIDVALKNYNQLKNLSIND
jgi:hypothetical protein